MKYYSVKEAAEITGIPARTISYICKRDKVRKAANKYKIDDSLISLWIDKRDQAAQSLATLQSNLANEIKQETVLGKPLVPFKTTNATKEDDYITEKFTQEEYDLFEKRLREFPVLKKEIDLLNESLRDYRNQVTYLQNSLSKNQELLDTAMGRISESLKAIHQQNFIEAKKHGFDE
jgi:hypothetical protein